MLKGKINNIRMTLSRLGDIVTKNERKKIKKDLFEIAKNQRPTKPQKECAYRYLIELANALDKKEEHKHIDRDDLNYFGIRDIENLLNIDNLINEIKKDSNEHKIQLSMGVNFMCITDQEKTRTFHVKSDNADIRLGNDAYDIINELIKSFLSNYQKEEQMLRNGSNYIFESVDILDIYIHSIKLNRGKSYIKSLDWISSKKTTINPRNTKGNKCFQYAITVALNHQNIDYHPERISNIKPFIDQYNWKDINIPSGIRDWEKFKRNNKDITLNILYPLPNKKEINIAYESKYNCKRKNQVLLLMITDNKQENTEEKWHYIALKSIPTGDGFIRPTKCLSALFRGITSNNNGDFYCFGCLQPYRTDNALKNMKDYVISTIIASQ